MTSDGKSPVKQELPKSLAYTQEKFDYQLTDLLAERQKALAEKDFTTVNDIDALLKNISYYPRIYRDKHDHQYTAIRVYYDGKWFVAVVGAKDVSLYEGLQQINHFAATLLHLKGGALVLTLALDPLQISESQRYLRGIDIVPEIS